MAILTDSQRLEVWRGIMRYWSENDEVISGIVKVDIRDSVNAADVWIDGHEGNTGDTTGYNGALPMNFKDNATAGQKSDLFIFVAARRRSKAMLQLIFGEVD